MSYLRLGLKAGGEHRFDGFGKDDRDKVKKLLGDGFGVDLKRAAVTAGGASWGLTKVADDRLVFAANVVDPDDPSSSRPGDEMLSVDLGEVSQCVLPGNSRNEIELQLQENDALEANTDQ
jgi:hypothetical protein